MNETFKIVLNYLLLGLLTMVYVYYCGILLEGHGYGYKFRMIPSPVCLLIFVYPFYHFKSIVRHIVPIAIWTLGFMIVFSGGENAAAAGAILLLGVLGYEAFSNYLTKKGESQERL